MAEAALPAETARQEVSGTDDLLCHATDQGDIAVPTLMNFNDWQKLRSGAGRRQTKRKDGVSTTPKEEAQLWRATMEANHGDDWVVALAALQAPVSEEEEAERR